MTVLIADDHPDHIYLLTTILEASGHHVVSARNGAQALEQARLAPPDAVISDLLMPVMDGFTLLREWRADSVLAPIPFLVLTATYTGADDEKLALAMGADAFLVKPAEPEQILRKLEEACSEGRCRARVPKSQPAAEMDLLQLYNKTLVGKLEKKVLELEAAKRALEEDVSARIKAEAGIHLFRSAVLQASEAILITDAQLDLPGPRIEFVNPAFTALTGYTAQEVLGKTPRILQGAATNRAMLNQLRESLAAGEPFTGSTVNYRKDRTPYHVELHIAPIRDGDGRITHYVGIQTDVTEQKEREQRLAEALARQKVLSEQARAGERAKSEFLAVMSHEIRTPLNSILGFAELIAQDCGSSEECREFAAIIGSSGQALLRILDDVLDFSRIEAGRLRMVSTPFCPAEVLKDVHAAFSREAANKGLELSLALPSETSTVLLGDAGRLRQVLVNLVGNAIKFTEHGSVEFGLRLGPGGTQQEFFVRDTGPGIPADKTSLIFDPFAQADASMSRRFGGIGLGLAIARRLAELMGGRIEVRSEPGQGAEFSLHLEMPIADASPAPPPIASASPDSSFAKRHPLRILVVEDDRINLKLALTILRKLGYEPVTAGNGRAALDLCRTQPFECILMDLHMPEMDGCEAARLIRAHEQADPRARGAYIAALTANIFPASRERCLQAGMDDCLTKPIQQGVLMNCLEKAALKAAGQRGAEPPPASSK